MPSFLLSIFMALVVLCVDLLNFNSWVILILQIIVGASVYFAGAKILKFECFEYILSTVKRIKKK